MSSEMIGALIFLVKFLLLFVVITVFVLVATWYERKVIGHMQQRIGPKRVGWHGLLQPVADMIKAFFKEDSIPRGADKLFFWTAPIIGTVFAMMAAAAIPFGPPLVLFGKVITLDVVHLSSGVLYMLAMLSLVSFGAIFAGLSTKSKYPIISAQREVAQVISYELILSAALLNSVIMAGSLDLTKIVEAQSHLWFIFYQPVAFVCFLISMFAISGRVPFDLPEAENELVAGFMTEFTGMKFSLFYFAQYTVIFTVSMLAVILFFGGWLGPSFLPPVVWLFIKWAFFIFLYTWSWATFPRYRYDQLMKISWKILLPIVIVNILWTGFALQFGLPYLH